MRTDVVNAYYGLQTNEQIVSLYESGYLDQATQSRDITTYAYGRGAATVLDVLDAERSYRATQLGLPASHRCLYDRRGTGESGRRSAGDSMRYARNP